MDMCFMGVWDGVGMGTGGKGWSGKARLDSWYSFRCVGGGGGGLFILIPFGPVQAILILMMYMTVFSVLSLVCCSDVGCHNRLCLEERRPLLTCFLLLAVCISSPAALPHDPNCRRREPKSNDQPVTIGWPPFSH